ncbi:Six-hairpin glycosidase [Auriscalpium vulgare]|uniref:Six-hairpin glycosidase n=1 Tax=Auriscalpium vulgare TaxID=40419 RepID=A0ACB8S8T7_9AGAM|nr:Six-hairpin glycosidase [Auriscalpium vulgare]
MLVVWLSILASCVAAVPVADGIGGLSRARVALVRSNALNISTHSWEIGTVEEALTELEWPSLSVFSPHAIPPPARLKPSVVAADVIGIAKEVVANKSANSLPLIDGDGAVGDPASIGSAVLLVNWTRTDLADQNYSVAAQGQLEYLLEVAPRSPEGAISHRDDQVQLWADFVYMAPPFIAYYGALQGGSNGEQLLQAAYEQCSLYRDALFDADASLWRHIVLGVGEDATHWGTGNAWAAAGMLRVLATIQQSSAAPKLTPQQANLTSWVNEILTGAWGHQQLNGTLLNTIDVPTSFADTSSTALLAASTFRYAKLTKDVKHIPAALRARDLILKSIDEDGWLQGTVDPEVFSAPSLPGEHSPEGQSFVMLLEAAYAAFSAR